MTDQTRTSILLLTGAPGTGKTTLARRIAESLTGHLRLAGFTTDELREAGHRLGFRIVPLNGPARLMAHVSFAKLPRVGRYGVDIRAIDAAVAECLDPNGRGEPKEVDVYIVDEVGRMECLSERFVAAMRRLLGGRTPLVATVARRGEGFIAEIKRHPGAELREVTRANRGELPARALAWLKKRVTLP